MCKHESFKSEVKVNRLTETEGGPVTGYLAEIEITCADCFKPFEFIGLPGGLLNGKPTTNVDGNELRVPIKPLEHGY
jgi:hypothetical protein